MITLTFIRLFLWVVTKKFNTFRIPLNFLSAICNGKISFKKAEIDQRDLKQKIEELKYNYNQNITKKGKRKRINKRRIDAGK